MVQGRSRELGQHLSTVNSIHLSIPPTHFSLSLSPAIGFRIGPSSSPPTHIDLSWGLRDHRVQGVSWPGASSTQSILRAPQIYATSSSGTRSWVKKCATFEKSFPGFIDESSEGSLRNDALQGFSNLELSFEKQRANILFIVVIIVGSVARVYPDRSFVPTCFQRAPSGLIHFSRDKAPARPHNA